MWQVEFEAFATRIASDIDESGVCSKTNYFNELKSELSIVVAEVR